MLITTKTIITFDPIKEYERIKNFMNGNNMNEWRVYPSTVGTTFVNERTYSIEEKEEE